MTLVLLEKGLVLEGSTSKIEDKQVPGIRIFITYLYTSIFLCSMWAIFSPKNLVGLNF